MLRDHTIPICPLPALGYCVRERGNFWDEDNEECTGERLRHLRSGGGRLAPEPRRALRYLVL